MFNFSEFVRVNKISEITFVTDFNLIHNVTKTFPRPILIDGYRIDGQITSSKHLFLELSDLVKFTEEILYQFNGKLTDFEGSKCFFICNGLQREVFSISEKERSPSLIYENGVIHFNSSGQEESFLYSVNTQVIKPTAFPKNGISIDNLSDGLRSQLMIFKINRTNHKMSVPVSLANYAIPKVQYVENELEALNSTVSVPNYFIDDIGLSISCEPNHSIFMKNGNGIYQEIKSKNLSWAEIRDKDMISFVSLLFDNGCPISKSKTLEIKIRKWTTNISINREKAINMAIDTRIKPPTLSIENGCIRVHDTERFVFITSDYNNDLNMASSKNTLNLENHFFYSGCVIDFRNNMRSSFSSICKSAVPSPSIQRVDNSFVIKNKLEFGSIKFNDGKTIKTTDKKYTYVVNNIHKISASCFINCPDNQFFESSSTEFVCDNSDSQYQINRYSLIIVINSDEQLPNDNFEYTKTFLPVVAGEKAIRVPLFVGQNDRHYMLERWFKEIETKTHMILNQFLLPDGRIIGQRKSQLTTESPLYELGYNVAENKDLSDGERQEILRFACNSMLYGRNTAKEIINFVNWLISLHPQHDHAIRKWKTDIKYLESLPQTATSQRNYRK